MTSVTPEPTPTSPHDETALLEVSVLHPRDAEAAALGGADRLVHLALEPWGGSSPELSAVSAVVRETDLPVRVVLRRRESLEADPGSFRALSEYAGQCAELGAAGFTFGFLDRDLEVDRATCAELAAEVATAWHFHRGFDHALEPDRAWRDVQALPGLDGVASAGSTRGFAAGGDELLARVRANPGVARLLLATGGVTAEEVPWLVRAGVRQFAVAEEVRPGGSWDKAYVDAGFVRAWRLLLDDALMRSLGIPVD